MSLLSRDDLQSLAQGGSPCVSLYLPTHRAGAQIQQDPIRLKNLLRQAEDGLSADGVDKGAVESLLAQARGLLDDHLFWQHQSDGLAIFLSPEAKRQYRLPLSFEELAVVGERFHLTPLLPLLTGDAFFYILALSQKRVRLLEATRHSVREIDLQDIPDSLGDAVGYDWEQRSLQFHTGAPRGGEGGKRQAMFHGHGGGVDDGKEEIAKFLQLIDRGLLRLIDDRQAPMVVAAVDYVIGIFREVTKHPAVVEGGIEGNPDELTAEDLHGRAVEKVEPLFAVGRRQAADRFNAAVGTGLASEELAEVVLAATDGRIDTLFVAPEHHRWGHFDAPSRQVEVHAERGEGDEDLLDRAALETLLHGGTVYAVGADEVPGDDDALAAVFRY